MGPALDRRVRSVTVATDRFCRWIRLLRWLFERNRSNVSRRRAPVSEVVTKTSGDRACLSCRFNGLRRYHKAAEEALEGESKRARRRRGQSRRRRPSPSDLVRLRLSREQRVLRRWMGGARFVYNAAVEHVKPVLRTARSSARSLRPKHLWSSRTTGSPPCRTRFASSHRRRCQGATVQQGQARERPSTARGLRFRNRRDASAWTAGCLRMFHCAQVVDRPSDGRARRTATPTDECK